MLLRAITLSIAFALLTPQAAEAKKKDLIVLLLIDALRADHTGSYGYERPTTPNLDVFAKDATRYTRMYVNAPWTRPSAASFLTGLHASRHRTETAQSKLAEEVLTIAERLKEQGYVTAGFTANGNGGSLANLHQGFDVFEDTTRTYTKKMRGKTYCCYGLPTGEFIVKRATQWLEKNQADKTFMFMFFVDPHDPYGAPPEIEEKFLGKDFKGTIRREALWERNNDYPPDERFSLMALYDAGIHYADIAFQQFVDYLRKEGLYDRANIMVSADHGEGFGEHGFYLHAHHFWEEVIHVPLLVKGRGFAPGAVETRLTQSIDVARAIAELGGAPADDLPGYSLLKPAPADAHVISEYNEFGIHRQAIIGKRYKVIWQRPADEEWYLRTAKKKEFFPSVSFDKEVIHVFDLEKDPQEKNNLADNMPPEAAALLEKLRQFVAESDALAKR